MTDEINQEQTATRFDGMSADANTLELLLSPEYVLQKMRHSLLGEVIVGNPLDNNWKQLRKPIMNKDGVNEFMQVMENAIGIPQELTNLSTKQMNALLNSALNAANDFIMFRYDVYGLDESSFSSLMSITEINLTTFLMKGVSGFKSKFIKGLFGMKENITKSEKSNDNETPNTTSYGFGFGGAK